SRLRAPGGDRAARRPRGDHAAVDAVRDPRGGAGVSGREELRVPELAEPISHYTDAVRANDLLFVSGCVAVDGAGRLVGGDDVADVRTTYGSRIYADHVPRRTASAVDRLVTAGATVVGKANLHEFAWGVTSQNPWYGTVQNPRLHGRTTGGSSGGNAAALAAGLCDLGLGTDTGCSIRLPASCCGVVGLKPSWGRIPVDGI